MTTPGWYPDPDSRSAGMLRWWDGAQWTEHQSPASPALGTATIQEDPAIPRELRWVVGLLLANLALSILLTVVTIVARHSIVNYQLDHRHITDPATRDALRHSYIGSLVGRVIGNIVVSVVYAFLVRALFRGRRWAYRRVIWLGSVGILGLILLQFTPYPPWMRAEQLVQALVLAALVCVVRLPEVRDHFAAHLPGRNVRRFRRS